ncbi:MAG: FGGY-family carbohydrate kinase [Candidatus Caldatribacteriaceae bacterium]
MDRENAFVLGIDLGTQGVRSMIANFRGRVIVEEKEALSSSRLEGEIFEQDPAEWARKVDVCVSRALGKFFDSGYPREALLALSCDSTSGTVVMVDQEGRVLRPAIMYNDSRAKQEATLINTVAASFCDKMGYRFDPSFALCKVLWTKKHEANLFEKTRYFLHAADYLVGVLTGEWGVSDISNSLKMGYDLVDLRWPDFIERDLEIPIEKLPAVHITGEIVGELNSFWAERWRCGPLKVVAGATDGTASFYASGVENVGDISSTLGTTLVVRSISERRVKDPQGRVYCHLHPERFWLPGGASNTGGECLNRFFAAIDLSEWDERVKNLPLPTSLLVYPLVRQGERLPFANPQARFFKVGEEKGPLEFYAACLEGVGYIERYSFELLEALGASPARRVFSSGSGTKSFIWNQIRADILNRSVKLPATLESAMGSCIIAASPFLGGLRSATQNMVTIVTTIEPRSQEASLYEEKYRSFVEECRQRGYG